ncbi:MAG: hypothetical protein SFX18_03615 [Pirellulales bacterium]|nr:hypothetical protein [Pirellulales bacterium]
MKLDQLQKELRQKPKYFAPQIRNINHGKYDIVHAYIPHLDVIQSIFKIYGIRLRARIPRGELDLAVNDLESMIHIGNLRSTYPLAYESNLAMSQYETIYKHFQYLLRHKSADSKLIQRLLNLQKLIPANVDIVPGFEKGERLMRVSQATFLARTSQSRGTAKGIELYGPEFKSPYADFDWDQTTKSILQVCDQRIANLKLPDYFQNFKHLRKSDLEIDQSARNINKTWKSPRAILYTRSQRSELLAMFIFSDNCNELNFLERSLKHACRHALASILLALELYRFDHGHFPQRLSELSPPYLSQIPLDPYTKQEFVYRSTGQSFIAYSVGPNLSDDGGIENWHDPMIHTQSNDYAIGTPDQVPVKFWLSW